MLPCPRATWTARKSSAPCTAPSSTSAPARFSPRRRLTLFEPSRSRSRATTSW
ncbi:hypothetical protein GBAR_LOCUS3177 [Geodia barretti]|uniref:Uncharacterized protein n=1 Tax=Geodia barretti TaxID=519541 RepID=A0AA35R3E1_GEOBA|nr:hypothetical protein GBAR_LOCUS3177 [Geodia barretti]